MGTIMLKVIDLKCDNFTDPVGVSFNPGFSWRMMSDGKKMYQQCRSIQIAVDDGFTDLLFDKTVDDASCINVKCDVELMPLTRYFWRVKICDNFGNKSSWSEPGSFVTALAPGGLTAPFISGESKNDSESSAGTIVRGEFTVKSGVKLAILNSSALGVYIPWLNNERVGDLALAPGWTEYASRLLYQSYDVTGLLKEGVNAAGAMVGPGWYKGNLGFKTSRCNYGDQTAFAMQLVIKYEDGTTEIVNTGDDWRSSTCPALYSEIYHGETYDARMEQPGWAVAGYDVSAWKPVEKIIVCPTILMPQDGPPVRKREVLKPKDIFKAPNGEQIIDFGQNLTGWVRLHVKGNPGDIVEFCHAEILDKEGNFYSKNLRSAKEKACYILKGEKEEVYEPLFTFYGFRYIRIDKFPGEVSADNFEAIVVHSDMLETGSFNCSHNGLNQLEQNIRWGMKGNFLDIPTDCPQRDERMGWTGDAQVFIRAAFYLHDAGNFFRKWFRDMAIAQAPSGSIPYVVPDILLVNNLKVPVEERREQGSGATGWGDAATVCPWITYIYSGDVSVLEENYPMMKAWVEYIRSRSRMGLYGWMTGISETGLRLTQKKAAT